MKVIIELNEALHIFGQYFEAELKPEDVVIRTEPAFEIEIRNLKISEGGGKAGASPAKTSASAPTPTAVVSEEIEDVLRESEQLRRADRNVLSAVPDNSADEV